MCAQRLEIACLRLALLSVLSVGRQREFTDQEPRLGVCEGGTQEDSGTGETPLTHRLAEPAAAAAAQGWPLSHVSGETEATSENPPPALPHFARMSSSHSSSSLHPASRFSRDSSAHASSATPPCHACTLCRQRTMSSSHQLTFLILRSKSRSPTRSWSRSRRLSL